MNSPTDSIARKGFNQPWSPHGACHKWFNIGLLMNDLSRDFPLQMIEYFKHDIPSFNHGLGMVAIRSGFSQGGEWYSNDLLDVTFIVAIITPWISVRRDRLSVDFSSQSVASSKERACYARVVGFGTSGSAHHLGWRHLLQTYNPPYAHDNLSPYCCRVMRKRLFSGYRLYCCHRNPMNNTVVAGTAIDDELDAVGVVT